jgi:hypothetical protein
MAAANASAFASSVWAAFINKPRRAPGPIADHAGKARAAASTAAFASAAVAAGAVVATEASSGLSLVKLAPLLAATASPLMSMEIVFMLSLYKYLEPEPVNPTLPVAVQSAIHRIFGSANPGRPVWQKEVYNPCNISVYQRSGSDDKYHRLPIFKNERQQRRTGNFGSAA